MEAFRKRNIDVNESGYKKIACSYLATECIYTL